MMIDSDFMKFLKCKVCMNNHERKKQLREELDKLEIELYEHVRTGKHNNAVITKDGNDNKE